MLNRIKDLESTAHNYLNKQKICCLKWNEDMEE